MNESVGSALLFNLVLVFVIILSGLFIGSLAYTKAFKVKNRIIEEIEKQGEHSNTPETAYRDAEEEIVSWLNGIDGQGIGYRKNFGKYNYICNNYDYGELQNINGDYSYCVYQINTCVDSTGKDLQRSKCGIYYHVIAFMYFDFPLVEEFPIAVHGETMTFKEQNN